MSCAGADVAALVCQRLLGTEIPRSPTSLATFPSNLPSTTTHPPQVRHIFGQICCGVAFCHSLGVAHRDLKPENVLILRRGAGAPEAYLIKVADFGLSTIMQVRGTGEGVGVVEARGGWGEGQPN